MTKEQAVVMAESRWWDGLPARLVAEFQLRQPLLCMDFAAFHAAVEEALKRPVFTHEFMFCSDLLNELLGA